MKRYAACIEYDGSRYKGWQKQPHAISVQEVLEQAISTVANQPTAIVCAGRTDTGVHSVGQIIHFETKASRTCYNWQRGINSNLPPTVSVHWVQKVLPDFHARFSATQRYYRYIIANHAVRPAILRNQISWQHLPLDETLMQRAAKFLIGKHDFTSFRSSSCQANTAVRNISSLIVKRQENYIYVDISADAFLHHMVRNIAGTLMQVGSGKEDPDWVRTVLEQKDRCQAGMTASPSGLYLQGVDYPGKYKLPKKPPLMYYSGE